MGFDALTLNCQDLIQLIKDCSGADAVGVTRISPVSPEARRLYKSWLAEGRHGDMSYLERYQDVRDNPALLLEGARTIAVAAFSFANPEAVETMHRSGNPLISEYALGRDYHKEIRKRLKSAAHQLTTRYGGQTRICVDTAPLRERYWAVRAGLGFIGLNNYLIIPDAGAHFVLGSLLWTGQPDDLPDADLPADCTQACGGCGKCVRACPTGALSPDGRLDARRCLSYLTIESRQPLPPDIKKGNRLFGCDTCRRVCPHQSANIPQTAIEAFHARKELLELTHRDWLNMTPEHFDTLTDGTALRRTTLAHIQSLLTKN